MREELDALTAQHAELAAVLEPLDEAAWASPSACEGWSIADVVLHLAQTDELALASVEGRLFEEAARLTDGAPAADDVDGMVEVMVDRERGGPGAEILARWQRATAGLRDAFGGVEDGQRVLWVAGEMSARSLATTRIAETWVHTRDVAEPLGVLPEPTDRIEHIARLAWRTLPYAFRRAGRELSGPVAFELTAPDGSTWSIVGDDEPLTTIRGAALDLCLVATQRVPASGTGLSGEGPDADGVLELVRSYA